MKKFEDIWKKANEEANLKYDPKGVLARSLILYSALKKRIEPFLEKQQPEIPEVPKEVANIYEKHKDQHHKLSVILEELYVNTFATFGSSLTQGEVDDIVVAMRTNGYTVAQEKRFYLKAKELLVVGEYDHVEDLWLDSNKNYTVKKSMAHKFSQQEIDSMATDSYEKIEVEEER